jgi:hypothetical protein
MMMNSTMSHLADEAQPLQSDLNSPVGLALYPQQRSAFAPPPPGVNVRKVFKIKSIGPDFSKPSWLFTAVNGEGPAVAGPVDLSKSVIKLLGFLSRLLLLFYRMAHN